MRLTLILTRNDYNTYLAFACFLVDLVRLHCSLGLVNYGVALGDGVYLQIFVYTRLGSFTDPLPKRKRGIKADSRVWKKINLLTLRRRIEN